MKTIRLVLFSLAVLGGTLIAWADPDFTFSGISGNTADPFDFGLLTPGTYTFEVTLNDSLGGTSNSPFNNLFVFSIASDANVSATFVPGSFTESFTTQLNTSRYGSSGLHNITQSDPPVNPGDAVYLASPLTTGDFELVLLGNRPTFAMPYSAESYSGSLTITAVPEPSFAGLGLALVALPWAVAARRRKTAGA